METNQILQAKDDAGGKLVIGNRYRLLETVDMLESFCSWELYYVQPEKGGPIISVPAWHFTKC